MKNIVFSLVSVAILGSGGGLSAQIIDPKEAVENKAKDRLNGRIDQSIDQGLNSVEEGIGNLFKKKKKKAESKETQEAESKTGGESQVAVKKISQSPLKTYSNFDFISGAQTVAVEDFGQDAVGDFPSKWETNATGEVVTLGKSSQKWLYMNSNGWFSPEFIKLLPENFTLEMDVYMNYVHYYVVRYGISFVAPNIDGTPIDMRNGTGQSSVYFSFSPRRESKACTFQVIKDGQITIDNQEVQSPGFSALDENNQPIGTRVRLSFWRQKNRLRIYANDQKIIDNPSAFKPSTPYSKLIFNTYDMDKDENGQMDQFLVTNIRMAIGAPDTRNKLLTEGKFISQGIQFEVNAATIKPESYGALKEIAQVLNENPSLKVKVVGHTDNTGDASSNTALSLKRAQAVIQALISEFQVPSGQLQADGKGSSEPVTPNDSPLGKAQNRRVEFIKQ